MARKFSYPEVKELEVGQSVHVDAHYGQSARKIRDYAKRAKRDYSLAVSDANAALTLVTRLPDPEQAES